MVSDGLPLVSAIVAAYNYADYIGATLDSALTQDYPADRLEIVIVDDGSTDGTAAVIEEYVSRYPTRIRAFRQENAGYEAATARAFAEARGEMWALLDADDLWAPDKTSKSVQAFQRDPRIGFVYTDISFIDADSNVTVASRWNEHHVPHPSGGDCLTQMLVIDNVATASAIMFRADLAPRILPLPPSVAYIDWWTAIQCSAVSHIEAVEVPLMGYRVHGGNLTQGAEGPSLSRERVKQAMTRRAGIIHSGAAALRHDELEQAWASVQRDLRGAAEALGDEELVFPPRWVEDEAAAARALAHARSLIARGRFVDAQRCALVSAAHHPSGGGGQLLSDLGAVLRANVRPAPGPVDDARAVALLARLEELEADPGLLAMYAGAVDGDDEVTLVVHAPGAATDTLGDRLEALLLVAGTTADAVPDLLVIPDPDGAAGVPQLRASTDAELGAFGDEAQLRAFTRELLAMTVPPAGDTPLVV